MSKAKVGMKCPMFAPITAEAAGKLPTYGEKILVGEAISASLTVNMTSGELHGDDALLIKVSDFVSGTIALNTVGIDDDVAAALYGATVDEGLVVYNAGDSAPNGGFAYYAPMVEAKTNKPYFKGIYFPKVQAAMGNDNSATKAGSVTIQTANTTLTVMKAENGDWMHTEILETEAAALAWVEACLTPAAPGV